jgi:hypothetical protein
MKWEQDLIRDIRTGTEYDDRDGDSGVPHPDSSRWPWREVTEENRAALTERFLKVRDTCQSILEIGVCRNLEESIAYRFLEHKKPETIYVGIDLDDKSFLNDSSKHIYTIQGSSSSVEENIEKMKSLGVQEFGFIFIDGWHSINQCLIDWEYTRLLAPNGIVGFHDTSVHPGPYHFIKALNKDIWEVEENVCPTDWGIGFARRK